jgi:hypothetical protein
MKDEQIPSWLGVSLISLVVSLEDERYAGVANRSGGHYTAESLAERLRSLGARPISRTSGEILFGVVEEAPDEVLAVGVAVAEPQDVGLLIRFTLDDLGLWDTEILDLDWADALLQKAGPRGVQSITRSDRGV